MGDLAVTWQVLAATICALPDRSDREPPREIWAELAATLCAADAHAFHQLPVRYRLLIPDTRKVSPGGDYWQFRTVNIQPRVKPQYPVLVDIDVGNWFCAANVLNVPIRAEVIPDANWVRKVSSIALQEHVERASHVFRSLKSAGWATERVEFTTLPLGPPAIETASGCVDYTPDRLSSIARMCLGGQAPSVFGVMQLEGRGSVSTAASALRDAWRGLSRSSAALSVEELGDPCEKEGSATLVLIPDNVDLTARPDLRDRLRDWEAAGCRFKLTRVTSLNNKFSVQNICFDLAGIAGAMHWDAACDMRPAVAFDAGHDTASCRSRWACAGIDRRLQVTRLRASDGGLAEHIPDTVAEQFWPRQPDAMVLRDGRLARERMAFMRRAKDDGRWLLEVKKHPHAVLFRRSMHSSRPQGAKYGDALLDPHDDVLLQTISQGSGDCVHPVRVSTGEVDRGEQLQALFDQTAVRTLSMFRPTRLPGGIYWADLASKLDKTGWSKAIGRGWRLATLVPQGPG
jgi:hypothetical protein